MRELPIALTRPQRIDGPEGAQQQQTLNQQVSQLALFRVFRVTTTGGQQVLNTGVAVGTWYVGRKTAAVDLFEVSLAGQRLVFQATAPGVDVDIIVLF